MKNQIAATITVLAIAAVSAPATTQSLGGRFGHSHGLGWGTTNFGSSFKSRADAVAANYNSGWFANTSYSSIHAEYRARLLSSTEHDVVDGRVYAFAGSNVTSGSTRLTIGSLDFLFWPQSGSYKSVGGNHTFSHSYGWKQWFGRLVQGKKYFSGILVTARMSSTIDVNSRVTMSKLYRQAKVRLAMVTHPYVTVQVANTASAFIEGHVRPLFPEDATFTLDSRPTRCYGSGIVDYNDLVSMVIWIKRLFAPKIMLAVTNMNPRNSFPTSSYVGGKSYLGFRLF